MSPVLLLARGRDRLETTWKQRLFGLFGLFSYSLGDAIDWKQHHTSIVFLGVIISYSLGDAIDWKLPQTLEKKASKSSLLLARGRDRLETVNQRTDLLSISISPTR